MEVEGSLGEAEPSQRTPFRHGSKQIIDRVVPTRQGDNYCVTPCTSASRRVHVVLLSSSSAASSSSHE